jgi:hypothetical protein
MVRPERFERSTCGLGRRLSAHKCMQYKDLRAVFQAKMRPASRFEVPEQSFTTGHQVATDPLSDPLRCRGQRAEPRMNGYGPGLSALAGSLAYAKGVARPRDGSGGQCATWTGRQRSGRSFLSWWLPQPCPPAPRASPKLARRIRGRAGVGLSRAGKCGNRAMCQIRSVGPVGRDHGRVYPMTNSHAISTPFLSMLIVRCLAIACPPRSSRRAAERERTGKHTHGPGRQRTVSSQAPTHRLTECSDYPAGSAAQPAESCRYIPRTGVLRTLTWARTAPIHPSWRSVPSTASPPL